jgi:hypothetical protein
MGIQWNMVHWWVLAHFGPSVVVPSLDQLALFRKLDN